nr:hypothetical protein [Geodermatophilaceae bacterium]
RVRHASLNPPYDGHPGQQATLYGDPDLGDTLDGPLLLVGSTARSASIGGPPGSAEDGRVVDLGDHDGFLIGEADWTWVADTSDGQDYVEFVVGRGVDDQELIRAAAGAQFTGNSTAIAADSVPAGLQPLISAGGRDGPYALGVGETLVLEVLDGSHARVIGYIVRADPRLAAMWGFWAADSDGTMIRGQPGSAGDLVGNPGDDAEPARVWAEAGMVFSVQARGSAIAYLDDVVNGLRVGTEAELASMQGGLLERNPTAEEIGCPPGSRVVSAVQGDVRWVLGVGTLPGNPVERSESCTALVTGEGTTGGGIGSFNLAPLGQLSSNTSGIGGLPSGLDGTILGGVAPPGTARVSITDPDGVVVDAVLSVDGPRPGERLFGQFFTGNVTAFVGPYEVTAFDAAGAVLAMVTA